MNLSLSEDQVLLRDAVRRLLRDKSSIERVRAAGQSGFDPALWAALVDLGVPFMRVPTEQGGVGLSLLDAALIAEEAGRALASSPVVEVIVASRLLAVFPDKMAPWIARMAQGSIVVPALEPVRQGVAAQVPYGAAANAVIALDGDDLVLVHGASDVTPVANSGWLPIADWSLASGQCIILASGETARAAIDAAIIEWKLLSAAWLAGLSRSALDAASAYANERIQFGRPIGSFQGLAHPLADAVTEVEGGQLLTWRAIAAIAEGSADAAGLAMLAWWWAGQSSTKALRQAIRTLGGYGLSLEYDMHLYHRRGTATVLLGGDPEQQLRRAGDLLFTTDTTTLPDAGDVRISFAASESTAAHERRLSSFFEKNWTDAMSAKAHHSTASHDRDFHRKLAEERLIFRGWPGNHTDEPSDAANEDFAAGLVFERWNYTSHVVTITNMIGQVVLAFGSDAAKNEVLPLIKSGQAIASLGFSEPASGSDVFAARTAARRDGDDWIINGQKMFTTAGHYADYVLLLARTSDEVRKHDGLTVFLVPTAIEGYEAQAVHTYQDERTNITFYTDMRVPDRYRLGDVGQGATVLGAALALEHGGSNYFSAHTRAWRNAWEWAHVPNDRGLRPIDSPRVRTGLARVRARHDISRSFVDRAIAAAEAGQQPHRAWGSMAKMFICDSFLQNCWDILEMGGPSSVRMGHHPLGMVELDHRRAYGATIYGGTSEIHRSIVAEQALGLPKSRS